MKKPNKALLLFTVLSLSLLIKSCDKKIEDTKNLKEKIIQLDKAGWEAWKNKNGEWFKQNTTSDFVSISAEGISNKKQVIAATVSSCNVTNYKLEGIEFHNISETSVLLTYIVLQNGTCNGLPLNSKIQVAANYVLENNKWLEAFYMESKIESQNELEKEILIGDSLFVSNKKLVKKR